MTKQLPRVLLLEDNEDDAEFVQELTRGAPAEPIEISHVVRLAEAADHLRKERFDVVISDLNVPDSQGLETFLSLHAQFPKVPIIVLTGMADQAVALRAMRQGAQDYLVKGTIDTRRLLGSVRYAIERQRLFNEVLENLSKREKVESALRKCGTAHLWQAMFSVMGEGASVVLYSAGHAAGQTTFDFVNATFAPPDDAAFARALGEHFGLAGFFILEGMQVDRDAGRLEAQVHRSFEVEVPHRVGANARCHFMRGLFAGIADRLLGMQDLVADETACEREGADSCAFVVRPLRAGGSSPPT